jgi:hypothetical protein
MGKGDDPGMDMQINFMDRWDAAASRHELHLQADQC